MASGIARFVSCLAIISICAVAPRAHADGDDVNVGTSGGFIHVGVEAGNETSSAATENAQAGATTSGHYVTVPVCVIGGSQTCGEIRLCGNGEPMSLTSFVSAAGSVGPATSNCSTAPDAEAPEPQLTLGIVAEAFRRIDLPSNDIIIQPPNGRTLVNFETNFYTKRDDLSRAVNLLGRRVEFRIHANLFTWRFGDGTITTTDTPGAAFPNLEVTHRYIREETVQTGVDTTYTADYRVGDQAWRPVPGAVTVDGDNETLSVVEARPALVNYER